LTEPDPFISLLPTNTHITALAIIFWVSPPPFFPPPPTLNFLYFLKISFDDDQSLFPPCATYTAENIVFITTPVPPFNLAVFD
jgi:hypothetical protein